MPEQSTKRKPRLGRGLSSLMTKPVPVAVPENPEAGLAMTAPPVTMPAVIEPAESQSGTDTDEGLRDLDIKQIVPNAAQPRRKFDSAALEGLAQSIRAEGVMQPVIVRANGDAYELVAGERRWRAAQMAGLTVVPAIVRELDDLQVAQWSLVENLQREDLNPIERAEAFRNLSEKHRMSHEQIADQVGVERSTITNALRLLNLHPDVRSLVIDGHLSNGQAKALVSVSDPDRQFMLARQAIQSAWSVRQVESAVRKQVTSSATTKKVPPSSAHLADLEQQISEQLNTKVQIRPGRKKGTGTLGIEFYSVDQFDELLSRLNIKTE